jgi:hypothetical protein
VDGANQSTDLISVKFGDDHAQVVIVLVYLSLYREVGACPPYFAVVFPIFVLIYTHLQEAAKRTEGTKKGEAEQTADKDFHCDWHYSLSKRIRMIATGIISQSPNKGVELHSIPDR